MVGFKSVKVKGKSLESVEQLVGCSLKKWHRSGDQHIVLSENGKSCAFISYSVLVALDTPEGLLLWSHAWSTSTTKRWTKDFLSLRGIDLPRSSTLEAGLRHLADRSDFRRFDKSFLKDVAAFMLSLENSPQYFTGEISMGPGSGFDFRAVGFGWAPFCYEVATLLNADQFGVDWKDHYADGVKFKVYAADSSLDNAELSELRYSVASEVYSLLDSEPEPEKVKRVPFSIPNPL